MVCGVFMRELILEYSFGRDEKRDDEIVTAIVDTIITTPSRLCTFKKDLAAYGDLSKLNAICRKVFLRLELIPEVTDTKQLPSVIYRGERYNPKQIIEAGGMFRGGGTKSILEHKETTGSGIYISASKNLNIAIEHAVQYPMGWVYKIKSVGGICVNSFLEPFGGHLRMEEEVVYPYKVSLENIISVGLSVKWEEMATEFYPLSEVDALYSEVTRKRLDWF